MEMEINNEVRIYKQVCQYNPSVGKLATKANFEHFDMLFFSVWSGLSHSPSSRKRLTGISTCNLELTPDKLSERVAGVMRRRIRGGILEDHTQN